MAVRAALLRAQAGEPCASQGYVWVEVEHSGAVSGRRHAVGVRGSSAHGSSERARTGPRLQRLRAAGRGPARALERALALARRGRRAARLRQVQLGHRAERARELRARLARPGLALPCAARPSACPVPWARTQLPARPALRKHGPC